jgi:L-2,4-diaminobutyrate decarboxylase
MAGTAARASVGSAAGAPLAGGVGGAAALEPLLDVALRALRAGAERRGGPLPAGSPADVAAAVRAASGAELLPERGVGAEAALAALGTELTAGTADPADPACAGHLHTPPLAVAVAAEVIAAALNPSLDSWDQGPSATEIEALVVDVLAGLVGYPSGRAAGVITSGGTESNLMGLLLARDAAAEALTGRPVAAHGLGAAAGRLRFFCGEVAHFSVRRNAALLGLGEEAVVAVPVDGAYRMDPAALAERLAATVRDGLVPAAVVATAGSTDFGGVDPLRETVRACAERRVWCHVDAAYGGGALFSDRLAGLLDGLADADSVALDLHKLGWQPVAAGVFLTARAAALRPLARRVAYLNPADDEAAGYPSLLGHSLRTTRRVDAFKMAVTFRALGRHGLGRLVDACHDLARHAAARIDADPRLELAAQPVLSTVVFRYRPDRDPAARIGADRISRIGADRISRAGADRISRASAGPAGRAGMNSDTGAESGTGAGSGTGTNPGARSESGADPGTGANPGTGSDSGPGDRTDRANAALRRRLLAAGTAVVGRTEVGGAVWLKLTLLNPYATGADLDALLDAVVRAGATETWVAAAHPRQRTSDAPEDPTR